MKFRTTDGHTGILEDCFMKRSALVQFLLNDTSCTDFCIDLPYTLSAHHLLREILREGQCLYRTHHDLVRAVLEGADFLQVPETPTMSRMRQELIVCDKRLALLQNTQSPPLTHEELAQPIESPSYILYSEKSDSVLDTVIDTSDVILKTAIQTSFIEQLKPSWHYRWREYDSDDDEYHINYEDDFLEYKLMGLCFDNSCGYADQSTWFVWYQTTFYYRGRCNQLYTVKADVAFAFRLKRTTRHSNEKYILDMPPRVIHYDFGNWIDRYMKNFSRSRTKYVGLFVSEM